MSVVLPTPGETNWDVPLNGALTDLDSAITTIGNLANAIPAIQARINGETFYRLVASNQSSTNVKNKADFVCDGTDDQVQIQAAVDAAFAEGGGIVQLTSGTFQTTAPITLHPLVSLVGPHSDQIMNPGQFTSAASIKPQATFSGGAVIVLLDQIGGGYASISSEQRITNLTIDGSASAASVHGIQGGGAITSVTIKDVTIRRVTGKGIYTFFQNSSQPFSWTFEGVLVDNSTAEGFHLINHSDFTMLDCISIGAGATGYVISNAPNSRMIGCRSEWSDAHGIYLTGNFGTGQGSGGMLINACSTDRNANNGILIDALGNGPINIVGCMTRRDGRNNNVGGGGYAGIKVLNATMPVVISGWTNYVGVDDNGTGVDSPVYAASVTGSSSVQLNDSYMHGATAALNDDGSNTIFRVGSNVVYVTGISSAPVRSVPASASTGPGWVNVKDYGADGNGISDDTVAIQNALNATGAGGICYMPTGRYATSDSITIPPYVTLMGSHGGNEAQSKTSPTPSCIVPLAGFVGNAVIKILDQGTGGYSTISSEVGIRDLTIDGTDLPANVDGIQMVGQIQGVILQNVQIREVTRNGINTLINSSAPPGPQFPFCLHFFRVSALWCGGTGVVLNNATDSNFYDVYALGNSSWGWYIAGSGGSQWVGCRAEWSGMDGFYLATNSGTETFVGCSTDRNQFSGFNADTSSSTGTIILDACRATRDGAASTTGGHAGLRVTNTTRNILVSNFYTKTGQNDDLTGNISPQYGVNAIGSANVTVTSGQLNAVSAGWHDGGGNTVLQRGITVTGTGITPYTAVNRAGDTMAGTLGSTLATGATVAFQGNVTGDTQQRHTVLADGTHNWGSGTAATDTNLYRNAAGSLKTDSFFSMGGSGQAAGQFSVYTGASNALNVGSAGGGLAIKEGTNARSGVATLAGGTATVSNTSVTATTRIQLTSNADGGTPGWLRVSAITAGTSFTITSSSGTDTSTVAWLLVEGT